MRERFHEYRFRRVSPAALRKSHHYRAVWDIRFLSFDPDTLEVLRDSCPECGKKLDWLRCYGVGKCNRCLDDRGVPQVDLRDYISDVIEVDDVEGLLLAPALLSPLAGVRDTARATLSSPWRDLPTREIVETLTSVTFMLSGGKQKKWTFAPPRRDEFEWVKPRLLARIGRMMIDGRKSLHDLVRSVRLDTDAEVDVLPTQVFGGLVSLKNNEHLSKSVIDEFASAMAEELRSRPYRRSFAKKLARTDGRVRPEEAGRRLGFSRKQVNRLLDGGHVQHILSGYRGDTVLIEPKDLEVIASELENSIVEQDLAGILGVTEGCMPLLHTQGLLTRSSEALNAAMAPKVQFDKAHSLEKLESILGEVPRSAGIGMPTVEELLAKRGPHMGRAGAALVAIRDAPSEFAVRLGAGSWSSRAMVLDTGKFTARLDEIPKHSEFLDVYQAADFIQTGWSIVAALTREKFIDSFAAPGTNKTLLTRTTVEEFASRYLLGAHVLKLCGSTPHSRLRQHLKNLGVAPVAQLESKVTLVFDRLEVENALRRRHPDL